MITKHLSDAEIEAAVAHLSVKIRKGLSNLVLIEGEKLHCEATIDLEYHINHTSIVDSSSRRKVEFESKD